MKAVLGLEDGSVFRGNGFGPEGETSGELIVTFGSNGYVSTLSDPAVSGQIVTFSSPLIGNYGASADELESDSIHATGVVVHELCRTPKRPPLLETFFEEHGVTGVSGIDTRMITRHLRECGTMRAALITGSNDGDAAVSLAKKAPAAETGDFVSQATCKAPYRIKGSGKKIAVLDLGCRKSALKSLSRRGADLYVYPYGTTAKEILAEKPASLFVTDGPGFPKAAEKAVSSVKDLLGTIPVQGVSLGCGVIAAAFGAEFEKLKLGHRSPAEPVRFADGTVTVTFQNHGYAICKDTLPEGCSLLACSANDETPEGFENSNLGVYAVQFLPEHDGVYDGAEKPIYDIMYRQIV
ncbi:MAG TPA: carbamoyl phosphate synthase small subunit [Methanocorpusculum sp.]|nr:carbamoyl phosphate synthase small subunit [Methanocorpusculum sp.]